MAKHKPFVHSSCINNVAHLLCLYSENMCIHNIIFTELSNLGCRDIEFRMSASGEDPGTVESFLHTLVGVTTVVVAAGLVTVVTGVLVCVYCCYQYRHRHTRTLSTPEDAYFPHNGTTNDADTALFSYSINSLATEHAFHHTSLESILSGELEDELKSECQIGTAV